MAATADIAEETPLQDDVRRLIGELNEALLELTPAEYCYHMTVEEMAEPETTLFVGRIDGDAVAIGAFKRHSGPAAEVKRMYTRPEAQGNGIGGKILERIEALAAKENYQELVLETGDKHPAAWRVYERAGFERCGAVLDYEDTGYSIFYRKPLTAAATDQQN
ncbi:MAG: GNAT family N-acetyltransferase [Pseudomonadota bacterium]